MLSIWCSILWLSYPSLQEIEPRCGEALCRLFTPDDNVDLRAIALKAKRARRAVHAERGSAPSSSAPPSRSSYSGGNQNYGGGRDYNSGGSGGRLGLFKIGLYKKSQTRGVTWSLRKQINEMWASKYYLDLIYCWDTRLKGKKYNPKTVRTVSVRIKTLSPAHCDERRRKKNRWKLN